MANIRSAAKQARKGARRRLLNTQAKDSLRQAAKKIQNLVKEGKQDEARALVSEYQSKVDKASKVGRLKKNTAARRKSRVARLFKPVTEQAAAEAKPKKSTPPKSGKGKPKKKPAAKK